MIQAVYGFKDVFESCVTSISGYSKARAFRFIKYEDNIAMFYKESSLDVEWKGLPNNNSRGILLFSDVPSSTITFDAKPTKSLNIKVLEAILKCSSLMHSLSAQSASYLCSLLQGAILSFLEGKRSRLPSCS